MPYDFRDNRTNYEKEKEVREKRLSAYSEDIQKRTLEQSCELIRQLVEERQRQGMTQQEVADITGILPSNLARLESGKRVPTLVVFAEICLRVGKTYRVKALRRGGGIVWGKKLNQSPVCIGILRNFRTRSY